VFTRLSDLHPVLVHVPITLLPLAVVSDLLGLALVGLGLLSGAALCGTRVVYRHGVGLDRSPVSRSERSPAPFVPAARTPLP
jgi:uncharacterized membrane protein